MLKALLVHGLLESRLMYIAFSTSYNSTAKVVFSSTSLGHTEARTLPKICNNSSSLNKNGGSPTSWDIICNVLSLPMGAAAGYMSNSISA